MRELGPLVIPSATAWLPLVVDFVADVAAAGGLGRDARYKLRLAVDEIVTNIVNHGYVAFGHDGVIRLVARVTADEVVVVIEDEAPRFDPHATPTPGVHAPPEQRPTGGLGIFLARQCVDELRHEEVGGLNRNTLVVRRPPVLRHIARRNSGPGLRARLWLANTRIGKLQRRADAFSTFVEPFGVGGGEVFAHQLAVGRRILESFRPVALPSVPGWTLDARLRAARNVGGDLYDAFLVDGTLVLVLADVCDKGAGAAVFMALLRTLVRAFCEVIPADEGAPDGRASWLLEVIERANAYLVRNHGALDMFATIFVGAVDLASGAACYVNAGHGPVLHLRGGEIVGRLAATGPAMGVLPQPRYRVGRVSLAPGDGFLAYTDGVTDARNAAGEAFGARRAEDIARAASAVAANAAGLVGALEAALDGHVGAAEPFDDIAVLGVVRA